MIGLLVVLSLLAAASGLFGALVVLLIWQPECTCSTCRSCSDHAQAGDVLRRQDQLQRHRERGWTESRRDQP